MEIEQRIEERSLPFQLCKVPGSNMREAEADTLLGRYSETKNRYSKRKRKTLTTISEKCAPCNLRCHDMSALGEMHTSNRVHCSEILRTM